MKTKHFLLFILLAGFILNGCDKEETAAPSPDPNNQPQFDHSLIMSRGSEGKIVLTNPVDGKDLFVSDPVPAPADVKSLKAGYMCKNALFVSKTFLRDYVTSIYVCDAKTGADARAITGNDLNVQDINVSPAGPNVVFTGKPKDNPEYKSLYTINEDGSGLTHISEHLEIVSGPNGGSYQLQTMEFPVFSPDGSKIAADALVVSYPQPDTFYDFIVIMNNDGTDKESIYSVLGKNIQIKDLCWTQDGNFLLFVQIDNDDAFHRRIKALNIGSRTITDLTSALEIEGDQVNDIYTSPNSDKIVFNLHLGGGSDLYIAQYETHDDVLTIKGSPVKLTDKAVSGYKYYLPSWQKWDENMSK
jgi:Tol biopolymer transport system component